jgi:hypothetical protein
MAQKKLDLIADVLVRYYFFAFFTLHSTDTVFI